MHFPVFQNFYREYLIIKPVYLIISLIIRFPLCVFILQIELLSLHKQMRTHTRTHKRILSMLMVPKEFPFFFWFQKNIENRKKEENPPLMNMFFFAVVVAVAVVFHA